MINLIGIDKTVIKNAMCKSVDMDKLLSKSNSDNVKCIAKSENKYNYWLENREDNFNCIYITDNEKFNTLKIDVKKIGSNFIKYSMLDMSVALKGQNNLVPLTVDAYKQKVIDTYDYIYGRYGIKMDISNLKFEKIELNATIELDGKFEDYTRVLNTLVGVAPRTYKTKTILTDHTKNKNNMYEVSNKSIKCKFYDKSEQLKEIYKLDLNKTILRVEYTLSTSEKMKSEFAHNDLNLLCDEDIKIFVKEQYQKDFVESWKKKRNKNKTKLIKLCKEYKNEHKQWIKLFLLDVMNRECSGTILLFDIEDLKEVFEAVDKKNANRNMKSIYKLNNKVYSSFIGVNNKINEIMTKINNIE